MYTNNPIMATKIAPYICPECGADTLFFITKYGKMVDYKFLVNSGMTAYEVRNRLRFVKARSFRCMTCGKEYIIDWTRTWAYPVTDVSKITRFYK